jgi:hypothetical protein
MNRCCRHLFASATFSEQEHRSIRPSYLANEREGRLHLRAGAEHVFKEIGTLTLL